MSFPDKPIANPVAILREEFDDWAALFNPDTADAVGISPVGVIIWKLMDGMHTASDIRRFAFGSFLRCPGHSRG